MVTDLSCNLHADWGKIPVSCLPAHSVELSTAENLCSA